MEGWKYAVAEMATGVALGILIGKMLKKPRLAAMVAIGPVVLGGLRLLGSLVNAGPFAAGSMAGLSDLGMMAIEPYQQPMLSAAPQPPALSAVQVGPGVPSWMMQPEQAVSGIFGG
jgi:hypothetical protein